MRYDSAKMPAAEIKIRRMDHADILAIVAIEQSVHGAPHWPRSLYEEALLVGSPRPRLALVASQPVTGEIAGFVVASLIAPEAEIESIAVAESVQRRGVGRELLQALATELREQAISLLHLEVRASNLSAIRFYESENFKQVGVRPRYYTDPEEDAVLMALHLA
jgi:ribosomal-protein-alanine acetyltransferase